MLIITTSISGSGRKDYIRTFEKDAKRHGKKIKVYHIGEMLFEHAKKAGVNISRENVLNANPYVINSLRSAVFENVLSELPKMRKQYDAVIVNLHSFFFWKKIFMRAYDRSYVNEMAPDMFITFVDDSARIKERLDARKQWKQEDLTSEEILLWQNVEVETTVSLGEFFGKPFYMIAIRQPASTLYRLIFHPEIEPIYISMPMTHLPPKDQLTVTAFIKKLDDYFVVFDPRTIEIDVPDPDDRSKMAVSTQTVALDLYYLIRQSKKIIAYFPRLVSSPGAINELREGFETNKDVWIVYPEAVASPFLTYFCNKLFRTEKEFFDFLKLEYGSRSASRKRTAKPTRPRSSATIRKDRPQTQA